jgi:hypothetical protein
VARWCADRYALAHPGAIAIGLLLLAVTAPDRKTQKIPLSIRRSFTLGMPRGLLGSIGLMALHSSLESS